GADGELEPVVVEQGGRGRVAADTDERQLDRRTPGSVEDAALSLVRAQQLQAVKDRSRVPKRAEDGERTDTRAREPVLEPHGQLANAVVAEGSRHGEQLEVECEPLDEQQRQDVVRDTSAEDLQPDLGVPDVEPEQQPVQLLVAPARDSARAGVLDDGVGMTLGADGEVEALAASSREERRNRRRVEIEVGIDECDPFTTRDERTCLHGVALAQVAIVVDDADASLRATLEQPLGG